MLLNTEQISAVAKLGLYLTHRCDQCGKVLNQSYYYCIRAEDNVRWCSRECQNKAMGWIESPAAIKATSPRPEIQRICGNCDKKFITVARNGKYCSRRCEKMARARGKREARRRSPSVKSMEPSDPC